MKKRRVQRSHRVPALPWLAGLISLLSLLPHANAEWPQILGPQRDGVATAQPFRQDLPSPLPISWIHNLGQGYAGPAVADDIVYVFHRLDDQERLEALDLDSGKQIWKADFPATYQGGVNPDQGPRCVPIVDEDTVVVFGAGGMLHAVDRTSGTPRWTRDLYRDYRGNEGYFGAGSTPLLVDDRILVNVGGRDGAGIVAISLKDGKTLWKSTREGASYSSPALIDLDGKKVAVFVTRLNTVGINVESGEVAFRFPFGRRGPTVNAATPIAVDDRVFLTSSYQVGAMLFDPENPSRPIWENDRTLSSQYNTPVALDGKLFGIHGREDIGVAELRCVDANTGRVLWTKDGFGVANLIRMQDRILLVTNGGELVIVAASPEGYQELARGRFSDSSSRALPALSNGRLLVRDNQGQQGVLYCIDLRP